MSKNAAIILAAGKGTRMQSSLFKPLHKVAGRTMLRHVIATCENADVRNINVIIAPDGDAVAAEASPYNCIIQHKQDGTGDAVKAARTSLENQDIDNILVLYGDAPLITPEILNKMIKRREETGAAVVVAAFRAKDPLRYGRLITDGDKLERIVEFKDASDDEKKINLCNSGLYCIDGKQIWDLVEKITPNNAAKEYYLTDIIDIANSMGLLSSYIEGPEQEFAGANTREELAALESIFQSKARKEAMARGATLIDPDTVYFSYNTVLGKDVVVEPGVFFGPNVIVEDKSVIKGFAHLENVIVKSSSVIGPFAYLTKTVRIEQNKIREFVEFGKIEFPTGEVIVQN